MKAKEIIALAEKSGCEGNQLTHDGAYNFVFTEEALIAFARAIADLQKEKDAQLCDRYAADYSVVGAGAYAYMEEGANEAKENSK